MLFQPIGSESWLSIGALYPFGSWMTLLFMANRGERRQLLAVFSTGQLQMDFTAGKCGLFYHKDDCDDSYFCVIVWKKTGFFCLPVTCVDVLLKATVNMLAGNENVWGTGFPMLTVYSAFSVSVWMSEFFKNSSPLVFFFTLKLQLILPVEFF